MFEHRSHPLLPRRQFLMRFAGSTGVGLALIAVSLGIGMLGYHTIAGQAWPDAFVNAAMILSGMGPIGDLRGTPAKIFAGCYALFSGLALITIAGIVFAPVVHRFLHRFHLEHGKRKEEK